MDLIIESTYRPEFSATVWKMYKYINEKIKNSDKLFWLASGNSVGYYKYDKCTLPWDDDIDLAFISDNDFSNYIDFLVQSIKEGFLVNLHMKNKENSTLEWYNNDIVINLILDTDTKLKTWKTMKVSEFREIMKKEPSKFHFANITMKENKWITLATKLKLTDLYRWPSNHLICPWIDIIPHLQKDNMLICHLKGLNADLINDFNEDTFLGVPGKFPKNLLEGILHQYNEGRSFENFITWDTIYSHIKKNKFILHYKDCPELLISVKKYIKDYNQELLKIMDKINYNDLV